MGVIEARDLRRTYKTTTGSIRRRTVVVEAVRGVSFEVGEGELFGLLGPNGAGKTTTIKMLITLLIPTAGEARVLGFDVGKDAREGRKRIGYVFGGDRGVYERLASLTAIGKTVLLTTHYMFEADALCDRIAVIAQGKIVAEGTPHDLKAGVADGRVVEIEVYGTAEDAVERLRVVEGVRGVSIEERGQGQGPVVQVPGEREVTHALLGRLDGSKVGRVSSREPTLEDAYVALVTDE